MTSCLMKPNGKVSHILKEIEHETKEIIVNDYVFIVAGTNDIKPYLNTNAIKQEIKNEVNIFSHTNVIITYVPFRYDEYSLFNKKINKIKYGFLSSLNKHF